jgi:Matrixin
VVLKTASVTTDRYQDRVEGVCESNYYSEWPKWWTNRLKSCTLGDMTESMKREVTLGDAAAGAAPSIAPGSLFSGDRLRRHARLLGMLMSVLLAGLVVLVSPFAANAQDGTLHWAANKVYVVDATNSAWPVHTAADRLGANSSLWLVWTHTCPAKSQCIFVKTKTLTGSNVGQTTYAYSGRTIVSATVYLDTRFAHSSYRNRLTDTTHELGHAVGLNHTSDKTSCMYPYVNVGATTPNAADYSRLRMLYPTTR